MIKTPLTFVFLFATAASAGDHYYPTATSVLVAGPKTESCFVCSYNAGTGVGPGPTVEEWACDEVALYGARDPVLVKLPIESPVRVIGAKWAWVIGKKDQLIPMQDAAQ
jgi:hypothetical protein